MRIPVGLLLCGGWSSAFISFAVNAHGARFKFALTIKGDVVDIFSFRSPLPSYHDVPA
jgi:hypothetical protein